MGIETGTVLGPYRIEAPIGAGGMGEVYRAKDTRLDRTVAVKVLPEHLAEREERKDRFAREAKAISQLNHPNICTLYDVGEQDGVAYLVMEHIEGETLAERLKKGAIPLDQALEYGMQIADGLDKAHRAGIVHRDLKPANVMLTKSGVKLLDFGLAKLLDADDISDASDAPTVQKALTKEESIIGTLQYMAPEQLERKSVDARTDIFAFGNVLYEMLSGKKAFDADSQAGLIANIVHVDPSALTNASPALERTVKKCLAKDPDARWQSAGDLVDELAWIARGAPDVSEPVKRAAPSQSRLVPGILVASLLAFAVLAFVHFTEAPPSTPVVTFDLAPPPGGFFGRSGAFQALSPDGTTLVFVAEVDGIESLWRRRLDSLEPEELPDTKDAGFPFWSADGRSIGFAARGSLRRVELDALGGGRSQVVFDGVSNARSTWNDRGDILFSDGESGVIRRVSATGGTADEVTTLNANETGHSWPQFLPDGNRFLYVALSDDGWTLEMASLIADEVTSITPIESSAYYSPPGYLLSVRQRVVTAQRVDPDSLELIGDPVPIAPTSGVSPIGSTGISISGNGVLANRATREREMSPNRMVWYDRRGESTPALSDPGAYAEPEIAPDGERFALTISVPDSGRDFWVVDRRAARSRLTLESFGWRGRSQWTQDAGSIVFSVGSSLFRKDAAGGSERERVFTASNASLSLTDLSPDGRRALVIAQGPGVTNDIWIVPLAEPEAGPEAEPEIFLESPFAELDARFSPDGRFIVYTSDESGSNEIYVRPHPRASGQWQVSTDGGEEPRWRGDGRELFYITPDERLAAVPITTTPTFAPGVPETLFELKLGTRAASRYDVTGDGQRFLVVVQENDFVAPITITVNWPALLETKR